MLAIPLLCIKPLRPMVVINQLLGREPKMVFRQLEHLVGKNICILNILLIQIIQVETMSQQVPFWNHEAALLLQLQISENRWLVMQTQRHIFQIKEIKQQ